MAVAELIHKRKKWLDLVKRKPVAFGIENGFEDLRDIHNEWLKSFLFAQEDMTLQAHRGSYKTTCLSIAIAMMIVIYPKLNIIFLRKADDDVKEIIVQVGKLLQTDIFQALSLSVYGTPIEMIKQSAFEIDTNLKSSTRGTSQLLGIGSRASLTGKHADIVITDDIVNIDDRISKAHRERTKMTYQELQNIKNRGGRFINTGTPWHADDAFTLMPNIETYDCYNTGLIDKGMLQKLRDSMSPSLFAANYELKHIADADSMFTNPQLDDGSNTERLYDGECHIDAAYGGGDYTAFTILKERDNTLYVYGRMWPKHVDDVLYQIENLRKTYRAGTLHNEKNADKGYLLNKIQEPKHGYHERENKYIKISTYLRSNWQRIVFIDGTDPKYISQILDYTENSEHDDAPDSLASLIREAIENREHVGFFRGGI